MEKLNGLIVNSACSVEKMGNMYAPVSVRIWIQISQKLH